MVYVLKNKNRYAFNQNLYNIRNCKQLRVQLQRLSLCLESMVYSAPKIFNELPDAVASLNNFVTLKHKVK